MQQHKQSGVSTLSTVQTAECRHLLGFGRDEAGAAHAGNADAVAGAGLASGATGRIGVVGVGVGGVGVLEQHGLDAQLPKVGDCSAARRHDISTCAKAAARRMCTHP